MKAIRLHARGGPEAFTYEGTRPSLDPESAKVVLGLIDDIKGPSPITRLGLEVVIGVIAAWVLPARDPPGR